jgi:hypothetical protein
MEIIESEKGCRLHWETTVAPVAIEPFIKGSMDGCISRLEELLGL